MITDTLRGGLLLCAINLVVVMSVLGILAWVIGLVPRLLRRLGRTELAQSDTGDSEALQIGGEVPAVEQPVEAEYEPPQEPAAQAAEEDAPAAQYVELPPGPEPQGGRH